MEQIREILEKYTEAPIMESSKLIDDLGLDSFLIVYFLTEVEDFFGVDIDAEEFVDVTTVGDVLERVCRAAR